MQHSSRLHSVLSRKDCLWKQRTHCRLENGSLGFIETLSLQELKSIFEDITMGPMIPKGMKYNLHYGEVRGDVLRQPHDTNTSCSVVNVKTCLWKQRTHYRKPCSDILCESSAINFILTLYYISLYYISFISTLYYISTLYFTAMVLYCLLFVSFCFISFIYLLLFSPIY